MGIRFIKFIKYLFSCLLSIIYDSGDDCVICGEYTEETCLCNKCQCRLNKLYLQDTIEKDGYRIQFYSISYYSSIMKELILKLKYKSDFRCGDLLLELISDLIDKCDISFDVVTFVPSSSKVYKKRGFNQSEYLAQLIGKKYNKKVVTCLYKTKDTKDQIGLDGEGRWLNLKDSFKVFDNKKIINKKILLVDDVITTGATAFYCATQLIMNKCECVNVLTVAKSKL